MIIDTLKRFMDAVDRRHPAGEPTDGEMRIAAAALLVSAAHVDGRMDEAEHAALLEVLARRFALDATAAEGLAALGAAREQQAVDLYGFTSALAKRLDQDGRQEIVEMLWEVVLADGEVDDYESNLVWRAAELLGVSTRDRVTLKQRVMHRRDAAGAADLAAKVRSVIDKQ